MVACVLTWVLAALSGQALDGRLWSYFDSRETERGPRLELELEDGSTRTLPAAADAILLAYLPEARHPTHPQLSVDFGDRNRVLVRFEVERGLAIRAARARFQAHPSQAWPPRTELPLALHAVTAAWEERGAHWANQPSFDAEPFARPRLPVGDVELVIDLTGLAREWAAGTRANCGLMLHAAEPIPVPPELDQPPAAGRPSAPAIERELLGMFEWAPSLEDALARARERECGVLVLAAAAFGQETLSEQERLLLATSLSHPALRLVIGESFVPVRVRINPGGFALAAAGAEDVSNPLAGLDLQLAEVKPPALIALDGKGGPARVQRGFELCDPASVLEFLGHPLEQDPRSVGRQG